MSLVQTAICVFEVCIRVCVCRYNVSWYVGVSMCVLVVHLLDVSCTHILFIVVCVELL